MADTKKKQGIKPIPKPEPEIGIDSKGDFIDDIINAAQVGSLDISSIDALSQSAQTRERFYQLIDSMAMDDIISAVLETYVEDAVQPNDKGQSIWIESDDAKVLDFANYIIESLNVNKNIHSWAYSLVTYGDVFIKFFRKSDIGEDLLFKNLNQKQALNEDVELRIYDSNDPYVPYVELVPNPGEMFDLQRFGKTHGYIQAPVRVQQYTTDELNNYLTNYKMKKTDVTVYDAKSFAHGCLETTSQRQPETVDIFMDDMVEQYDEYGVKKELNYDAMPKTSYSVKRGQSILYNSFRIWRELNLLEMSALLNRITSSSVIRVIGVNVGDMPSEQVQVYLSRLKDKMEQKTAMQTGEGMAEYNNPAPIINSIYIPIHENNQGNITATTIGGDFDPKALTDIEYFRDKLFGSFKVPKQYFGFTGDGAGFNGGTSLTITSARYGNTIKRIQMVLSQLVTDIINMFMIDRGLDTYVNKFTVKMQIPVTQAELDKRQNIENRVRYAADIMGQLSDIEDKKILLEIKSELLKDIINNSRVSTLINQYIDRLPDENAPKGGNANGNENAPSDLGSTSSSGGGDMNFEAPAFENEESTFESEPEEVNLELEPTEGDNGELPNPSEVLPNESFYLSNDKDLLMENEGADNNSYMPSPNDLGLDFTKHQD